MKKNGIAVSEERFAISSKISDVLKTAGLVGTVHAAALKSIVGDVEEYGQALYDRGFRLGQEVRTIVISKRKMID